MGGGSLLVLGLVARRHACQTCDPSVRRRSNQQGIRRASDPACRLRRQGVPPAAIADIVIAAIMFPMLTTIMEVTRGGAGERKPVWHLAHDVFPSPMIWPTALGFVFAAFASPVPSPINGFPGVPGSALAPCALFAIGASIDLDQILHEEGRILVLSAVKLVALSLVAFTIALAIDMEPFFIIAATLCASVPTAKNVYFLAGEYHVSETQAAAMISATTVTAVGTMMLWMLILAAIYPTAFHGHL